MMSGLWQRWAQLFEEDDPSEPHYDPVHLAATLIVCMVVIGALFWLLWTLLVYEGRMAKLIALLLCVLTLSALHRAYFRGR